MNGKQRFKYGKQLNKRIYIQDAGFGLHIIFRFKVVVVVVLQPFKKIIYIIFYFIEFIGFYFDIVHSSI